MIIHHNEVEQLSNILDFLEKLSIESYQRDYENAKATETCVICKRPAREYRDILAKLEYTISALCQDCQDKYFKGR